MISNSGIIVWIIVVALIFMMFFVIIPSVPDNWIYPSEVINTFEACKWCKNNCSNYYEHCPICIDGGSCSACVDYYREHFNLTEETFPCYCWHSDESIPTKLEWLFMKLEDFNSK